MDDLLVAVVAVAGPVRVPVRQGLPVSKKPKGVWKEKALLVLFTSRRKKKGPSHLHCAKCGHHIEQTPAGGLLHTERLITFDHDAVQGKRKRK